MKSPGHGSKSKGEEIVSKKWVFQTNQLIQIKPQKKGKHLTQQNTAWSSYWW